MLHDPLEDHAKYALLAPLGRGGMGEVFLAEHRSLGLTVVVKMLHPPLADNPVLADRLRLEAQACARLRHPNVVRVTDLGRTTSGRSFIVMEHLEGETLREHLVAAGGWLPLEQAIPLVLDGLAGLTAAHEIGLVHRDIKLDNLFVCRATADRPRPQLKLLDFGVTKVVDGNAAAPSPLSIPTATGVVVGTPRFFAPEQARGASLDCRADIYAMGLVLYTLLAGRGPFDDATTVTEMARAHVYETPPAPSRYAAQPIPAALDSIVLQTLLKDPAQRFQTAEAFGQALEAFLKGHLHGAPLGLLTTQCSSEGEVATVTPARATPHAALEAAETERATPAGAASEELAKQASKPPSPRAQTSASQAGAPSSVAPPSMQSFAEAPYSAGQVPMTKPSLGLWLLVSVVLGGLGALLTML